MKPLVLGIFLGYIWDTLSLWNTDFDEIARMSRLKKPHSTAVYWHSRVSKQLAKGRWQCGGQRFDPAMLHHIRNPHGSRACGFFATQKPPKKNSEKWPFGIHLGYIEKMPADLIISGLSFIVLSY